MKIKDRSIKVGVVYNAFDPSNVDRSELVYRKNTMLKTYLKDLPDDCDWKIGLNGQPVELATHGTIRLKSKDTIQLVVIPRGGNGVKSVLRVVAMIGIAIGAAAIAVALPGIGGIALAAAVSVIGGLMVNAVLAPKKPKTEPDDGQSYGYDGAKNTIKEGVALPVTYGLFRVAGNYIDVYTQNVGDDQYLYGRTVLSDGKIAAVSDPLLNDQPINNYLNVEWGRTLGEKVEPVNQYFNRNVTQVNKSIKLDSNWLMHTTTSDVDQLQINLQFPRGLVHINDKGKKQNRTSGVEIQYSEAGQNNWRYLGSSQQVDVNGAIGNNTTPVTTKLAVTVQPTITDTTKSQTFSFDIEYRLGTTGAWTKYKTVTGYSSTLAYTSTGVDFSKVNTGDVNYQYQASPQSFEFAVPTGAYQMRITGQGTMTSYGYILSAQQGNAIRQFTAATTKTLRRTIESGKLDIGRYDIRIRKFGVSGDDEYDIDELYLIDIGEITNSGVTQSSIATAWYRIKMNEQLSSIPSITWLVKGVEVNQYDIKGAVTKKEWSDNPAWIILDMLIGEERGTPGMYAIDFPMFVEWAAWCETKGLKFNGVFDQTTTLWDACIDVLKVGHAAFSRIGTKLSLAIDKPQVPSMLFGPGNIYKNSFKISYLPLANRANEFELSYYDKTDGNKQKTIRIVDPEANNNSNIPRPVTFSIPGIDNFEQAQQEAWYQLYNNRYLRRTVTFDAPIESIGLGIGDVALIQHDMMNWGISGRVDVGSTTTKLIADRKITVDAGVAHSVLVTHDSVVRTSGTVTSIIGNTLTITGAAEVAAANVKRAFQPATGVDREITAIGFNSGTTYVSFDGPSTFVIGQTVNLVDTDVIEEREVSSVTGDYLISVVTPFSQAPAQYANFMFGVKTIVKKPYRLKSLSGTGFEKRSLTFIEYNEAVYNPPEQIVPFPPTSQPKTVSHVTDLNYSYDLRTTDANTNVSGVLSWNIADTLNYGGADIYVALNGAEYVFVKSVLNVSECQLDFHVADSMSIKVVAFNTTLVRAPIGTAPSITTSIEAGPTFLSAPTNLQVNQISYLALGLVEATWNRAANATDVPVKYRVQVMLQGNSTWDEYATTSEATLRLGDLPAGSHSLRVRTERAEAYSTWSTRSFDVVKSAETIAPGATVGGTIGTNIKNPDGTIFNPGAPGGGSSDFDPPSIPTNLQLTSVLSDSGATLRATWTAPTQEDLAGYDLAVKEANGSFIEFTTTSATYELKALNRNVVYTAKVRAFDRAGNRSAFTNEVAITTARDTVAPSAFAVTQLTASYQTVFANLTAPADRDLAFVEVQLTQLGVGVVKTTTVGAAPNSTLSVIFTDLLKGTTYSVSGVAIDTSGNRSVLATSKSINTTQGIDLNDFTPGLEPVGTVTALPDPNGYKGPKTVFWQGHGLYTYQNGAWVTATSADVADGSITPEKLVDGAVIASKLNAALGGGNLVRNSDMKRKFAYDFAGVACEMASGFSAYDNSGGAEGYKSVIGTNGRNGGSFVSVSYSKNTSTKGILLTNQSGVENAGLLKPNSTYVFTFYYRGSASALGAFPNLAFNNSPTVTPLSIPLVTGEWQRAVFRLKTGATVDPNIFLYLAGGNQSSPGIWDICDVMLQEGEYPTQYAPAFLDGEVTTSKLAIGAVTTAKLDALAVTAEKVAANAINANKLVVSTRPVSVVGCNMRVIDGIFYWNNGKITYPDDAGNYITKDIVGGATGWQGWSMPVNFCFNADSPSGVSLNVYYDSDVTSGAFGRQIPLARWNNGNDFQMRAGVSTIITGGQILTDSVNANRLIAQTITADRMVLGTLTAAQMATGSLTARVLAVGNSDSVIPDAEFRDKTFWFTEGGVVGGALVPTNASWPAAPVNLFQVTGDGVYRNWYSPMFPVEINAVYRVRFYYFADSTFNGWFNPTLHRPGAVWFPLKSGGGYPNADPNSNAAPTSIKGSSGTVQFIEHTIVNDGPDASKNWQFRFDCNFTGGVQLFCSIVRVSDNTLIADGAITTPKIIVNTLNGDRITAGTLSADKIMANTVMSGSVQVGTVFGNQTLSTLGNVALNPAARINEYTTQIDPGKILISGGTTLANWRYGGDTTQIFGGAIAANTITANKLTIGNRGISFLGLNFEWYPPNNFVYWSEGFLYYQNDDGTPRQQYVKAGSSNGAGAHQFFYIMKDTDTVLMTQDFNAAQGNDRVMIGSWWGGSNLNMTYGGTIINGNRITTGTITADRLNVGTLSAITANIGLLRTATSGARTEIDGNAIRVYDANNVLRVRIGVW